ncbi:MAG: DUF5050 domain-containing protein, partial [Bacteroidetes bacterium]|nr:DUF5050 domain-containing protein [Bacteroidota bacterium]
ANSSTNTLYFAKEDTLMSSNLDGSNIVTLITGLSNLGTFKLNLTDGYIYWDNFVDNSIQRARLDGSEIESIITGVDRPTGIDLDMLNQKIYWASFGTGTISRANLDGTNVETIFLDTMNVPSTVLVNNNNNRLYWVSNNFNANRLYSSDLDGSNLEIKVFNEVRLIFRFDIDFEEEKIFFSEPSLRAIMASDLDGTNMDTLVTNLSYPNYISLSQSGVGIKDNTTLFSDTITLFDNYPNPFNPSTTFRFYLPRTENVILRVMNIRGQLVAEILDERRSAGEHS